MVLAIVEGVCWDFSTFYNPPLAHDTSLSVLFTVLFLPLVFFRQESVPSTNQSQNITLLNSSNHNLAHSIHNFAQSIYNFAQPTITLLIYPWPFWVTAICVPYFVIDKKDFAKLGKGDKVDMDMEVADNKEKEEVLIKVIKMVDEIILSSKWNHCIISSVSGSVRSWLTTDQWRWS